MDLVGSCTYSVIAGTDAFLLHLCDIGTAVYILVCYYSNCNVYLLLGGSIA